MKSSVVLPDWNYYPDERQWHPIPDGLVELYHHGNDAESVRRLRIRYKQCVLDLLPTKGLSILGCSIDGVPLFWDPPLDAIEAPDAMHLEDPLLINGNKEPGSSWVAHFIGGVEMLGLDNWGMHHSDTDGKLHTLHGNVSCIPAQKVTVGIDEAEQVVISGEIVVHDAIRTVVDADAPPLWTITRVLTVDAVAKTLIIDDTITNVSPVSSQADWGYHVQLRPKPGCEFLLPSHSVRPRFGGELESDYQQWRPAKSVSVREERGYVHTKLRSHNGMVEGLLCYPDGTGIGVQFPHAPYTLAWNSSGGAYSTEFTKTGSPNTPIFLKPWDGVGPEFGASDLDHGASTAPDVPVFIMEPGQSMTLRIAVSLLDRFQTNSLRSSILSYMQQSYTESQLGEITDHVWRLGSYELQRLSSYVDRQALYECIRLLAQHTQRVVACGVGTSAMAARKLAHSLSCIEIPSFFLNPADAVHGALGSVQTGDIVFLISKGGGTKEIVQLIPSLKKKEVTIIGITENRESALAKASDIVLQVAIEQEADTFNMLATTSTLSVIALFDAIAIAVMHMTGFTKEQFAVIHPSGAVGERLLHDR